MATFKFNNEPNAQAACFEESVCSQNTNDWQSSSGNNYAWQSNNKTYCQNPEVGAIQAEIDLGEATWIGECIQPVIAREDYSEMVNLETGDASLYVSLALGLFWLGYIAGLAITTIKKFIESSF
jgi:hypothetical protein